jgi:biotin synthase-related radical SAM superfamily protein
MGQANVDRAKTLAQNLMEILTSYEEELMALERETPAMGQLRRAVGITIAEACYLITDQGIVQTTWAPPTDGRASPAS